MNPRDETDLDGDNRLVEALRALTGDPKFSIADELARINRQYNAGARVADDHFCRACGVRGHASLCPTCQSERNREARFTWGE